MFDVCDFLSSPFFSILFYPLISTNLILPIVSTPFPLFSFTSCLLFILELSHLPSLLLQTKLQMLVIFDLFFFTFHALAIFF